MGDDKKKYNHMENTFQFLNKNYVSLDDNLIKANNVILKSIVDSIISKMKDKDTLFKSFYRTLFHGGSYYDGLKVGTPEEYDLDLLLALPKYAEPIITSSTIPGFVRLELSALEKFKKQDEYVKYSNITNLLDEQNFVCTGKVTSWMQGVLTKALKEFPESGSDIYIFEVESKKYYAKVVTGGPAFTLQLRGDEPGHNMDIDLVPCFVFTNDKWPSDEFRQNPCKTEKPEFFVVPKVPKGKFSEPKPERCWRLSFQEQERVLMSNKGALKPSLKLLKKLRDHHKHKCISSYFIKTVFLWKIDKCSEENFWGQTLSAVYIAMLKEYLACIEAKSIPYFWNESFNLLGNINTFTLDNIQNKLRNIINEIEKNDTDSYIGAKALITNEEFEKLKREVPVNKRQLKTQNSVVNGNVNPTDLNIQLKMSTSSGKNPSVDCVDSPVEKSTTDLNTVLTALNKLQLSTDMLTSAVNVLQAQQQQVMRFTEQINNRMSNLESSMKNLEDQNALLRNKLKQTNVEPALDLLTFDNLQPTAQYLESNNMLPTLPSTTTVFH